MCGLKKNEDDKYWRKENLAAVAPCDARPAYLAPQRGGIRLSDQGGRAAAFAERVYLYRS